MDFKSLCVAHREIRDARKVRHEETRLFLFDVLRAVEDVDLSVEAIGRSDWQYSVGPWRFKINIGDLHRSGGFLVCDDGSHYCVIASKGCAPGVSAMEEVAHSLGDVHIIEDDLELIKAKLLDTLALWFVEQEEQGETE